MPLITALSYPWQAGAPQSDWQGGGGGGEGEEGEEEEPPVLLSAEDREVDGSRVLFLREPSLCPLLVALIYR